MTEYDCECVLTKLFSILENNLKHKLEKNKYSLLNISHKSLAPNCAFHKTVYELKLFTYTSSSYVYDSMWSSIIDSGLLEKIGKKTLLDPTRTRLVTLSKLGVVVIRG
jgi:hypothetical protein